MAKNAKWLTAAKTMQNDAATLQCPNDLCQASNGQTEKFCHQCGTPLLKRYLWAVGEGIIDGRLGEIVGERYLLKNSRILLDTKPGLPPENSAAAIPNEIKPYLRLINYRLQIPQVYGLVSYKQGQTTSELLLLEQAPIYTDAVALAGQLMPKLIDRWQSGTSMRQLNWLWQIAQLWQPLLSEGVASTLLNPQLLRVEGSLVRLLQLQSDASATPKLSQLGQLWMQLAAAAQPSIAAFLEQLCLNLTQGHLQTAEQVIAILDQGLVEVGRCQERTLSIATLTDKGPSRQRNEDACYPSSGTSITKGSQSQSLAIVCDGIGGHEGGGTASNLAVATIQQQIQQIPLDNAHLDATTLTEELESAIYVANDNISQRNDQEYRHGRQRMGTTLAMALGSAHEIYIAHVGDSRAYWITRHGCHQITLDDDVACREVRLGYALYRDALQHSSSGSLVQALGMSSSTSLHPTVQRLVLDEDCVFLLCSDGLSDYERVEECWQAEILPILDSKISVATAAARLVELANTQNGHDNVTVSLLHYQVQSLEPAASLSASLNVATPAEDSLALLAANTLEPAQTNSTLGTQLLPSRLSQHRFVVPLLVLFLILGLGSGLLVYFWRQPFQGNTPAPSASPIGGVLQP